MVSLYVCDLPETVEKNELRDMFQVFDGYIDVRMAKDRNR